MSDMKFFKCYFIVKQQQNTYYLTELLGLYLYLLDLFCCILQYRPFYFSGYNCKEESWKFSVGAS